VSRGGRRLADPKAADSCALTVAVEAGRRLVDDRLAKISSQRRESLETLWKAMPSAFSHRLRRASPQRFFRRLLAGASAFRLACRLASLDQIATSLAIFLLLQVALGCASSGSPASSDMSLEELARQSEAVLGDIGEGAGSARADSPSDAGADQWRIVLATISGDNAMDQAREALPNLRAQADLSQARIEQRQDGAAIVYGGYDSAQSEQAQKDLRRIRNIEVQGVRVFGRAFLAPPAAGRTGQDANLNLANVRQSGDEDALYTLQVGVYESDDRRQAMRAAEQAARVYRQQGEQAFYYHGPNRSMVTIGVFDEDDFDPQTGEMSQTLQALRQRHPHHLYNGQGVRETLPNGEKRLQSTKLVRIP